MQIRDIRQAKTELRQKFKNFRISLDNDTKSSHDNAIYGRILSLRQYRISPLILTYVSTSIEVDTIHLIEHSLLLGKKVAVPRCVPNTRNMEFYLIKSINDLEPGTFGVLEPIIENCTKIEQFDGSLCIVPGLGFDSNGYRIGYGKGYYDRFLNNYDGLTIGICYYNCVKWTLPHGRFDKRVDLLITERYLRRTSSKHF